MVEAQPSKANSLKQVAEELVGVSYEISLVGDQTRITVPFFELETGSGVFEEQSSVPRQTRTYAMTTVDFLLANKGWESVDLIKIDVQGYELEVLKGASGTLSNTEAVLLEVSFIPINKGAPLIHEVIAFMQERGFRIYDICSLIRRPLDKALWQADLIFVDQESPLLMRSTFD